MLFCAPALCLNFTLILELHLKKHFVKVVFVDRLVQTGTVPKQPGFPLAWTYLQNHGGENLAI